MIQFLKILTLIFIFTSVGLAQSTLPIKWQNRIGITTFKTTIQVISSAIIVGSNGNLSDGLNDSADGIYFYDGQTGDLIRRIHWSEPVELDVNGIALSPQSLFFGNDAGAVYAYAIYGSGPRLWKRQLSAGIKGSVSIEDLNSDGTYDVIAATLSGEIVGLNGKTGDILWTNKVPYKPSFTYPKEKAFVASPTLVDLNRDGTRDVVIGSRNGSVYAFDGRTGEIIWEYRTRGPSGVHASVWASDSVIIVAESYSTLTWLDFSGLPSRTVRLANEPDIQGLFSSPAVLPNGTVVIGSSWVTGNTGIWVIPSSDAAPIFYPTGKVSATAAIADGLGTGDPQAWVITEGGELKVIEQSGRIAATYTLDSGSETTPLITDIDKNGSLELVTTGIDKLIRCYQLPGKGPVIWENFRGNRHNSGVAFDSLESYPKTRNAIRQRARESITSPNLYAKSERRYLTIGHDSESTLISPEGIGEARLGTTWGRFKRAMGPDVDYIYGHFGLGFRGVSVVKDSEELFVILFPEWKDKLMDTDTISVILTYNRKFQTKEGIGPGAKLSECKAIYGDPTLTYDSDTNQESALFQSPPWNKIRFGLIPATGDYSNSRSVRVTKKYPSDTIINYIEIRN